MRGGGVWPNPHLFGWFWKVCGNFLKVLGANYGLGAPWDPGDWWNQMPLCTPLYMHFQMCRKDNAWTSRLNWASVLTVTALFTVHKGCFCTQNFEMWRQRRRNKIASQRRTHAPLPSAFSVPKRNKKLVVWRRRKCPSVDPPYRKGCGGKSI